MQKATVESKWIDMASAFERFEDPDNLLVLLREGTLIARGQQRWSGEEPNDPPPPVVDIPTSVWFDYRFVRGPNILTDDYETYYSTIQLSREVLDACFKAPVEKNKGGRPKTYDWEYLLPEIFLSAFEDEPDDLAAWVKQAQELDIWGKGSVADQKTLRNKLQPYFNRMKTPD